MCTLVKVNLLSLLVLTLLSLPSSVLRAQEGNTTTTTTIQQDTIDLPSEQVEVIKEYEAQLAEAKRLNISPTLPKTNTIPKNYDYNVTIVPVEIEYPKPVIRPLAMKPGTVDPTNVAWARLGYSTLKSPYFHGGYNFNSDDDFHVSAKYLHQGATDEKPILRKFNRNQLIIDADYQLADLEVYTQIEGDLLNRYLYGIDTIGEFNRDDFKRSVNNFSFVVGLRNTTINESDVHFDVSPFVSLTTINALDTKELNTGLNITSIKKVSDNNAFSLDLDLSYTSVNQDDVASNFTANLTPYFIFRLDALKMDLGVNYIYGAGANYIWPQVKIQYDISGERLGVMIGSDQKNMVNNYKNLSQINHFISPTLDSISNQVEQNIYAGANGNLFNALQYEAKVGYRQTKNMALFQDAFLGQPFDFTLAPQDVNAVFVEGYIGYQVFDWLKVDGRVSQQFFDTESPLNSVWYTPAFELDGGATLTDPNNKYRVRAMLSLASQADFLDFDIVSQTNAQYELSIDAEYFFTDHIGVFLQANNLLNNEYERWNRYPRYGIHLIGGASVKF